MQAVRDRQQELTDQKNYREFVQSQERKQLMHEETMQCRWIGTFNISGQRMCLQHFLSTKEIDIKNQLEAQIQNEEIQKTVTQQSVATMIEKWIEGFKFNQPSKIFLDSNYDDHDLLCII